MLLTPVAIILTSKDSNPKMSRIPTLSESAFSARGHAALKERLIRRTRKWKRFSYKDLAIASRVASASFGFKFATVSPRPGRLGKGA
jgi:hypothetical protein